MHLQPIQQWVATEWQQLHGPVCRIGLRCSLLPCFLALHLTWAHFQVEEVVGENDRLRAGAREAAAAAASASATMQFDGALGDAAGRGKLAGVAGGDIEHRIALIREENDLLRRENDLLVSQQV